jgi:RNA polymerase sigma factor (sigma-70 family)
VVLKRTVVSAAISLGAVFNQGTIGGLTDGQLLERFATDHGETAELAFAALVERHEALVWRVCMAILRDRNDAEDAFQATFLVLVRKARSLWVRDSLGPWIHEVASRTALQARTSANRRRVCERKHAELDTARGVDPALSLDPDVGAAVHEELRRLPEKYRAALVLCDLEGRTHQEAARALGWPIGTVKSRQAHGRGLIRHRLARRGLGFAVGAVAISRGHSAALAMPRHLARATVRFALDPSAPSAAGAEAAVRIVALTRGVLLTMTLTKICAFAAAICALALITGSAGVYVLGSQNRPPELPGQSPPQPAAKSMPNPPVAAAVPAKLRVQRIATRRAKATYEQAKAARELAEIAIEEFEEANYYQNTIERDAEINTAEAALSKAEDRLAWAQRMLEKGYLSKAGVVSEEPALKNARLALAGVYSKKKVPVNPKPTKTLTELRAELGKARIQEQLLQDKWNVAQFEELELEASTREKIGQ